MYSIIDALLEDRVGSQLHSLKSHDAAVSALRDARREVARLFGPGRVICELDNCLIADWVVPWGGRRAFLRLAAVGQVFSWHLKMWPVRSDWAVN